MPFMKFGWLGFVALVCCLAQVARAEGLVITSTKTVPGGVILAGEGGLPDTAYHVLMSSRAASEPGNWETVMTNQFDATGRFRSTNSLPAGQAAAFFRLLSLAPSANYIVSPAGGVSLATAVGLASAGDLIYLRGGTHYFSSEISLSRSGTPDNPIRVFAYPGEKPVLNFSNAPTGKRGIAIRGNCWHLRGLEVAYARDNGIYIDGKTNTIERCVVHHSEDSGVQLHGPGSAYNLVLNCDSYSNYDPVTHGENADGFAAKFTLGPGNVFAGCRAWENSDDGWDLWESTNSVVLTNCWTWRNGTNFAKDTAFTGDGNGFKVGGNYIYGPHYLHRCVAFRNPGTGFDQNNNLAGQTLYHNTAWANGNRNYNLNHGTNVTPHVLCNNLSVNGGVIDAFRAGTRQTNNSWQVLSPAAVTGDMLSVQESLAAAPRKPDGSLPHVDLLRPVPGGRLVDKGVPLGDWFYGAAPDLGAFESMP